MRIVFTTLAVPQNYAGDIKLGDNIEVMCGPFAGLIVRFVKLDFQNRLRSLFNLIEGKIDMTIDAEDVALSK